MLASGIARPRTPAQRAAAKFQYNDASIGEFTLLRLKAVDLANPAVNIAIKAFESELIKISPQLSSHVSVLFKKTSKLPSINSIINVLKPTKRITLEPLPYRL